MGHPARWKGGRNCGTGIGRRSRTEGESERDGGAITIRVTFIPEEGGDRWHDGKPRNQETKRREGRGRSQRAKGKGKEWIADTMHSVLVRKRLGPLQW